MGLNEQIQELAKRLDYVEDRLDKLEQYYGMEEAEEEKEC